MARQRKKFSKEEKLEAVRQIEDGEKTVGEVSREFGVASSAVSKWCTVVREQGSKAFPGPGRNSERENELTRLRRENASLKEDNEILKKAAAYFAKELR